MAEKFLGWWREDKRYITMIKALLLALLPVLCCVVYCASQGRSIGQVYLPNSVWNDELLYYKQVEGSVGFGYPQGYFGYDESHALKLSFAVWSPVLMFPWAVWGKLFGWNLMSPILCNIFLMMFCCFFYVWLVKPSWKQLGLLALLFCLYTPFVRYMLSGMPEVICFSMLILFYSLALNYLEKEKGWKLALLLGMSAIMTLMRPYFFLFLLLPVYFWVRRDRWKGAIGSVIAMALTMGLYACINHYLCAKYLATSYYTDWVTAFFEQGIGGGFLYTLRKLRSVGKDFCLYIVEAFRSGMAAGAFFAGYIVMLCIFIVEGLRDYFSLRWKHRQKMIAGKVSTDADFENKTQANRLIIEIHIVFSFVAMLIALLLIYKLTEGSKHFLTFMAAGIFVVPLLPTRHYKKTALLGLTFAFFYSYMAVNPYDYQVPFVTAERRESVEKWKEALEGEMRLKEGDTPSFDNVVIWVTGDVTADGAAGTEWQLFYSLPEGFGISCCQQAYVLENFDTLKSGYMATVTGGHIDGMCRDAGYRELYHDSSMILYVIGRQY